MYVREEVDGEVEYCGAYLCTDSDYQLQISVSNIN